VALASLEPGGEPGSFILSGELDVSNVSEIQDRLMTEVADGQGLTLDTSQLGFMDSQGLRMLIVLGKKAADQGQVVRILNCSPAVQLLLDTAVPDGLPGVEVVKKD
jgi:anti-anti-sigma factor